MNQFFKDFTNFYPLSKTLRFELKPMYKTSETIKDSSILPLDAKKTEDYKKAKKIIDQYHKDFIDECLQDVSFVDVKTNVQKYFELYIKKEKSDEERKDIIFLQGILREFISKQFSKNEKFKTLFKKELIKKDIPNFLNNQINNLPQGQKQQIQEDIEIIKKFDKFTTYFTGFHENRNNMYSKDEKSTAISYRIVNDNMPIFFNNLKIFENIKKDKDLYAKCNEAFLKLLAKSEIDSFLEIEDIFSLDFILKTVTQNQINLYNFILSGKSEKNGDDKGLNETINLFNQDQEKKKKDLGEKHNKTPQLKKLKKQILSDKRSFSFVLDKFENDQDLIESLKAFSIHAKEINLLKKSKDILEKVDASKEIWIKKDDISSISVRFFGKYDEVKKILEEYFTLEIEPIIKTKKEIEKKRKYLLESNFIKISFIQKSLDFYKKKHTDFKCDYEKISDYFTSALYFEPKEKKLVDLFEYIEQKQKELEMLFTEDFSSDISKLLQNKDSTFVIKEYLDGLMNLSRLFKALRVPNDFGDEKDEEFYSNLSNFDDDFSVLISLYNKTRNYLTKKPFSAEKIKITFENGTLLDGWDANKEKDNFATIFKKDGNFYLAIFNKQYKNVFDKVAEPKEGENYFEKMHYKLLPGANKMLPKVFLSTKGIKDYKPSKEIIDNYEAKKHTKGDSFDIKFCHELIDYFKSSIEKHPDWKKFDFKFSPTSTYEDISYFYKEVEEQGYKIEFKKFPESYIEDLVNDGKLYLFWIYNKDFSEIHKNKEIKANENLHTTFWKMLFDKENLKNTVYKLNGQAEIFYRKASIPKKITHKKGEFLENRNKDIFGKGKILKLDLYKDKRYMEDKFLFHVPITQNFRSRNITNINEHVNKFLHANKNVNIIGLDRGEKNLLYYSIINQKGEIIEQDSLNVVGEKIKIDYHEILSKKEKERQEARVNWKSIENIKELKAGYLSQVVHKIAILMLKHNALIVLEDLNFGFKRGRQKVEKQVYQKFEKALIDKLNFLVIKNVEKSDYSGALKALQLSNKFISFEKLGKQCGFLFYVPASYTSKIDPATGFVKVLNTKYSNISDAKKFFKTFDFISYNVKNDYFEFEFDYEKFAQNGFIKSQEGRQKWTACTYCDTRYRYSQIDKTTKNYNVTKSLKELFEKYNIDITKKDLKEQITSIDEADFFRQLFFYLDLTLTLRHSKTENEIVDDFILSPVMNKKGYFFDSRVEAKKDKDAKLPIDSDANGAYHIALKGLLTLQSLQKQDASKLNKISLALTNKDWFNYMQNRNF